MSSRANVVQRFLVVLQRLDVVRMRGAERGVKVIGVGESRVSQLRTQAIARLRSRLRESLQISEVR